MTLFIEAPVFERFNNVNHAAQYLRCLDGISGILIPELLGLQGNAQKANAVKKAKQNNTSKYHKHSHCQAGPSETIENHPKKKAKRHSVAAHEISSASSPLTANIANATDDTGATGAANVKSASELSTASLSSSPKSSSVNKTSFTPPAEVLESSKGYKIYVSLPGTTKENIKVDFNKDNSTLQINGQIPKAFGSDSVLKNYLNEITTGIFERKIELKSQVKLDDTKISASYENGILAVEIPKMAVTEQKMPNVRRIQVTWDDSEDW